jgi:hypothetical protein
MISPPKFYDEEYAIKGSLHDLMYENRENFSYFYSLEKFLHNIFKMGKAKCPYCSAFISIEPVFNEDLNWWEWYCLSSGTDSRAGCIEDLDVDLVTNRDYDVEWISYVFWGGIELFGPDPIKNYKEKVKIMKGWRKSRD